MASRSNSWNSRTAVILNGALCGPRRRVPQAVQRLRLAPLTQRRRRPRATQRQRRRAQGGFYPRARATRWLIPRDVLAGLLAIESEQRDLNGKKSFAAI
jgi:hypothetical protein